MGEEDDRGHRLQAERVVVHLHRCEGGRVVLAVLLPRCSWLHCVNDLEKGLERGGEFCCRCCPLMLVSVLCCGDESVYCVYYGFLKVFVTF